jgi:hypothetical protein
MPLDKQTVIWCIAIPAVIAAVAALANRWAAKSTLPSNNVEVSDNGQPVRHRIAAATLGLAWGFCVVVGMNGLGELKSWSEDGWSNMVWPILVSSICIGPFSSASIRKSPAAWPVIAIFAIVTAAFVMPTGEGWSDKLSAHRSWIAYLSIASICNTWSLYHLTHRDGERLLAFVVLATIACSGLMGAAAYGMLLNISLAPIAATFVFAIFALPGFATNVSSIIVPSVLFASSMIAAANFYSYADVPIWAYGLPLFAPTWIAITDRLVVNKAMAIRIAVAAVTATLIVAMTIYRFLIV